MWNRERHATHGDTNVSTRVDAHTDEPTRHDTRSFRNVSRVSPCVADWSALGEKEFRQCLKGISTYAELEGVANRRKWLNAPQLQRWSAAQREMILERKWELMHDRR